MVKWGLLRRRQKSSCLFPCLQPWLQKVTQLWLRLGGPAETRFRECSDKIRSPLPLRSLIAFPPGSWAQVGLFGRKQHLPKYLAFDKGAQCVRLWSHWHNLPLICDISWLEEVIIQWKKGITAWNQGDLNMFNILGHIWATILSSRRLWKSANVSLKDKTYSLFLRHI